MLLLLTSPSLCSDAGSTTGRGWFDCKEASNNNISALMSQLLLLAHEVLVLVLAAAVLVVLLSPDAAGAACATAGEMPITIAAELLVIATTVGLVVMGLTDEGFRELG